jgi:hypothetical protein
LTTLLRDELGFRSNRYTIATLGYPVTKAKKGKEKIQLEKKFES